MFHVRHQWCYCEFTPDHECYRYRSSTNSDVVLIEVRPTLKRIRMFDKTYFNVFGIITLPVGHLITGRLNPKKSPHSFSFYTSSLVRKLLLLLSTDLECYFANRHKLKHAILGCKACKLYLTCWNQYTWKHLCWAPTHCLLAITCMTEKDALNEYADLFDGVGRLEGEVHFDIDITVLPAQLPLRRLPIGVCDQVTTELRRLESMNSITLMT